MAAGVHVHAAAYRSRDTDEDVQPGIAGRRRPARGERSGEPCARWPTGRRPGPAGPAPFPGGSPAHPALRRAAGYWTRGRGRTTGSRPRGPSAPRRRRPLPTRAARPWPGRRCGRSSTAPATPLHGPIPDGTAARRPREPGIARRQPVHSGDISRASACHSWSERTSPARLRSAMIASQAAEAAERVVV